MMTSREWIKLLRGAARPGLTGTPVIGGGDGLAWAQSFRDGAGHRRAIDPWLLARVLGVKRDEIREGASEDRRQPWLGVWRAAEAGELPRLERDDGPLFPSLHDQAIEVWTEGELCGLHGLGWATGRDPELTPRLVSAARWLIENIQPDNATSHPWGVQVFATLGSDDVEADMYAQTLLHNALAGLSEPDVLSALILWDGADWLESRIRPAAGERGSR